MKMWKYWVGGVGIIILGIILGMLVPEKLEQDLLSPLSWRKIIEKKEEKKMEMVGFLPTWMIGKTKTYEGEIDQLIFSGIEVRPDGNLVWDIQSKKIDNLNYLEMKRKIKNSGGTNIVSIKMFDDKDLEAFINNPMARENLLNQVAKLVTDQGFDGVNIDFEYMSNATRILDDDFVSFMKEAKSRGWKKVGVDVFANTIIKGASEKIKNINNAVDWVVVMAYDFHRPGSDYSGPVAPIAAEPGERSINEIVDKLAVSNIAADKVVLALPLYGYEWATVDNSFGSAQIDGRYGRTVFYNEGVGFTGEFWNEDSMSPWVAWIEKIQKSKVKSQKVGKKIIKTTEHYIVDEWHQIHYENERSLTAKIDLAIAAKMGGVGFWALGYEGKASDLIIKLGSKL